MRRAPASRADCSAAASIAAPSPRPRAAALDRHPAEPPDAVVDEHAAGAHDAPGLDRDDLDRLVVEPVAVGLQRHSLLDAEDLLAQRERLLDLVAVARRPDVH